MSDLRKLRHLMQALRAPAGGCPWDKAQSFASIVSHTLEEAYEVADVIESGRLDDLPSELGDLLFQVIFYCQLGEEVGRFTLDDVVLALEDKLTRRHPHVFGNARAEDAEAASEHWETLKAGERRAHRGAQVLGELDDVPVGLPALSRAQKLQKRAARVGFDWPDAAGAWRKLSEEIKELQDAAARADGAGIDEELGDLLFAAVNVARHLGHDAEAALRSANRKFERRFRFIESELRAQGSSTEAADLDHLDRLWETAKRAGL